MLVRFASESARRPNGLILADVLAQHGPLAIDLCLRYATEIAVTLREMHNDGRAHGHVDTAHIALRNSGAALLPAERRGYADPLADLTGFGTVLYSMLTGKEPSREEFRLVPAKPPVLKGPAAVRAAATRLAERCLTAERETAPDMQKVLTEVRLLHVMSKQVGSEPTGLHAPPPPQEMHYPRPQPLEVFAGEAPPVINPPPASPAFVPPTAGRVFGAAAQPDPSKPGEDSPLTNRARGSRSRPVLDVICPKCKGHSVRLSRPRTRFERFLNLLGMGVHRCHRCFYRYIPFLGRKIVRKSN